MKTDEAIERLKHYMSKRPSASAKVGTKLIENIERTIEAQAKEIEIKDKEINKLWDSIELRDGILAEKDKEIERLKEGIAKSVEQLDISSDEQSWNGVEWAINDLRELL